MKTKSIVAMTIIAIMIFTLIPVNISFATDKCTVTFETNGGSKVNSVQVEPTQKLTLPEPPTKEGFVFGGWCIDEECEYSFYAGESITSDITLYAKWFDPSKVIKTLNLTMIMPEIGETINDKTNIEFAAETGANYVVCPGYFITSFPSKGEGYDEPFEGKFEEDKDYYFEFEYGAKEGYIFDNDLVINVNGEKVTSELNGWGMAYVKINVSSKKESEQNKEEFVIADDDDNDVDDETARLLEEIRKMLDDLLAGAQPVGIDENTASGVAGARAAGKQVKVDLSAKEVAREEVAEDVEKAEAKLEANEKVAGIFDVSINLKAGNDQLGKVTKLNKKVAFKLPIPEELRTVPAGYERIFSMLRIHAGVANRMDVESDGENVSGESDEYSTYVLTYTDTKITSNPKTGDMVPVFIGIYIISIAGIVVIRKVRK